MWPVSILLIFAFSETNMLFPHQKTLPISAPNFSPEHLATILALLVCVAPQWHTWAFFAPYVLFFVLHYPLFSVSEIFTTID